MTFGDPSRKATIARYTDDFAVEPILTMENFRERVKKGVKKLLSAGRWQLYSHRGLVIVRFANLPTLAKKSLVTTIPPLPVAIAYDADEAELLPSSKSIRTYECLMYLVTRLPRWSRDDEV